MHDTLLSFTYQEKSYILILEFILVLVFSHATQLSATFAISMSVHLPVVQDIEVLFTPYDRMTFLVCLRQISSCLFVFSPTSA